METLRRDEHPCTEDGTPMWNEWCGCGKVAGSFMGHESGDVVTAAFRCCCGKQWTSQRRIDTDE